MLNNSFRVKVDAMRVARNPVAARFALSRNTFRRRTLALSRIFVWPTITSTMTIAVVTLGISTMIKSPGKPPINLAERIQVTINVPVVRKKKNASDTRAYQFSRRYLKRTLDKRGAHVDRIPPQLIRITRIRMENAGPPDVI